MAARKKKKGAGRPSEAKSRQRDGDEEVESGDAAPASDVRGGASASSSDKKKGASWPAYAVIGALCAAGIFAVAKGMGPGSSDTPDSTSKVVPGTPEAASASATPKKEPTDFQGALVMQDIVVGKGAEAKSGDKVKVHYAGTLTNGTEFDASKKHGEEGFEFDLGKGRVIKGWDMGVAGMRVGGKRKLTIPSHLAYGAKGAGALIPPNSTLLFDVELLDVQRDGKKAEATPIPSGDPLDGSYPLTTATSDMPGKGPLVATIETSNGTMSCTLLEEKAPITVANFVGLATGKRPFKDHTSNQWQHRPHYDGTTFHRIIKGFMIQGGDQKGDGSGEPGYVIKDELWEGAKHDKVGLLCMANRGPDTNGAQFFITDAPAAHLDRSYTIFGTCSPDKVVHDIANVTTSPGDRPQTPVKINKVTIARGI